MKQRLLTIFGFVLLTGFAFQGIFGIAAALLLCGIAGTIIGFYKKDKSIWIPSVVVLTIAIIGTALFALLLSNSAM